MPDAVRMLLIPASRRRAYRSSLDGLSSSSVPQQSTVTALIRPPRLTRPVSHSASASSAVVSTLVRFVIVVVAAVVAVPREIGVVEEHAQDLALDRLDLLGRSLDHIVRHRAGADSQNHTVTLSR